MITMKKTTQYIAMAALTFSIAACTQDDTLQGFNDPNAVCINAAIGHLQSRVTYEASGATFFSTGDAIKVENTQRTTKNIATYTTADGSRWTTEDAFVWNSGTEANNQFQAWYPATASFDAFDLPTDQSDATKLAAADWMTASTAAMAKPEDGVLDLNFTHKLAKVTVNISSEYGAEYDAAPTFTDVKIYTYDGGKTIQPLVNGSSYTAIVTPGNAYTITTFMTLKANGVELTVKPTATLTAGGGLAAGSHYTFTLKVGKDAATISEVTVGEWDTETIPGGVADEVKVISVIEGSTATITIPDVATDAMVQNAMSEFTTEGLTTIIVEGPLNETRQGYIAAALAGKTVTLYLTHLAKEELIDELASADDGITVNCGYYMADASTYVAYNADGLQAWSTYAQTNPATNLSLGKDITLPLAEGETSNWTSVGSDTTPYTGTVNGNGYSITGMTIYQTTHYAGFIGYLGESGAVKSLKLKDVSVTTTMANAGGLVGYSLSVIENCAVEGGTISSSQVGGIVGYAKGKSSAPALIVACHNTAAVSGIINVGGIIGLADEYSKVIACYNSGTITHTKGWRCGGIAGVFGTGLSYLCCNYNTGTTSGETAIAGDTPSSRYHNYWSSDHEHANGTNSEGDYNDNGATKIISASEWQTAMTTMNTWLAENGYAYRYVLNTDAATKEAQPLVIVEASATE